MGNCCVTDDAARRKEKKKRRRGNHKPNPFSVDYHNPSASQNNENVFFVLRDPTGHDISQRYNLGRELGRGEFEVTYLCTDLGTGERLACKCISKRKLRTTGDIEDVRREVEIIKQIENRNL
ncbi:hypothetical protein LXL04_039921 [Taraxacum kok-saghyz]